MNKEEKAFCNSCNKHTNHSIKAEYCVPDVYELEINGEPDEIKFGEFSYQVIECNGCGCVSFRLKNYREGYGALEEVTKEPIEVSPTTYYTYFPERNTGLISEKSFAGLPEHIQKAYQEIIHCYNFNMNIMCAVGLRAATEALCKHFNAEADNLYDKIKLLGLRRLVSKELSLALQANRFFGIYAAHQLEYPPKDELKIAIEILEQAFDALFTVPFKHEILKKKISNRMGD